MANIVLNSLTYVGRGVVNGLTSYVNTGLAYVRGFRVLTAQVRFQPKQDTVVHWKLELPRLVDPANPSGVPAGTRVGKPTLVDVRFRFDEFSSDTERDGALLALKDLVLKAEFAASVTSLTQPAG